MGPASIESHYDEALAVPGLLDRDHPHRRASRRLDGYVIACFGDPGLDAARELPTDPSSASPRPPCTLRLARSQLQRGDHPGPTRGRRPWDLAHRYGMAQFCRNVRACEIPVLDLEIPGSTARDTIAQECKQAPPTTTSTSSSWAAQAWQTSATFSTESTGVPVIDGVTAATKTVESLIALGLTTSTRSEYAPPLPEEIHRAPARLHHSMEQSLPKAMPHREDLGATNVHRILHGYTSTCSLR